MFPLLKPGHLPALGFTTEWLYYRQNVTRGGSYTEKPLSCSTWRWVWADFSRQRLPCLPLVAIFHDLRAHGLRKPKQSNICKAQNIRGWPLSDSNLRFQRQRATQGLVSFLQGCDRGKQNWTTTHLQAPALLTQHSSITTQKIACFSGCSEVLRYACRSN